MLWYDEVVSDFDVREKVKHIITDIASNIKKAFLTLPGYEINASDSKDEESEECDSISIEQDELTFEHHACFAHTLQLVVKDRMAKAGQISTVIKKCSNLVSFVHRSTIAADVLRGKTRLQADNVTRWNSQLKMIKSVLSFSEGDLAQVQNAPKLTSHERNLLQDIVEILTPFEEATYFVQVSCVPSAGYVLPCIRGLNHHMQSMVSKYHSAFVLGLKQSRKKRMPYYEENETCLLTATLDPRFKLRWCTDDAEKQKMVDLLKSALERMAPQTPPALTTSEAEEITEPSTKKKKSLFNFMQESDASSSQIQPNDIRKVNDYLEAPAADMSMDPAKFWRENQKKLSNLSRLAKDILGVPSSSAPVERLFSIVGKIFIPERPY